MSGKEKLEEMQASMGALDRRVAVLGQVLMLKQAEINNQADPEETKTWLELDFEEAARTLGEMRAERKRIGQIFDERLKSLGVLAEPSLPSPK